MTGYAFHPAALSDLDEIRDYVAADNVDAAEAVIEEILTAIRTLVRSPGIGRQRPDLTSRPLRFIVVRPYLIAYAYEQTPLWVVALMHGRRNPRVMAAILRSRE